MRKLLLLLSTLRSDRREFTDRVRTIGENFCEHGRSRGAVYQPDSLSNVKRNLATLLGDECGDVNRDPGYTGIADHVRRKLAALPSNAPFSQLHNGDEMLAELCYVVCRLLRPEIVVETGVAYGVTSAHILEALHENGSGTLYSIDLPPLSENDRDYVGFVVPEQLKGRWSLHRGTSRRVLPRLLSKIGKIGVFCHDSLHTYWNMNSEFGTILPRLAETSVIIADDIEQNSAFRDLAVSSKPALSTVVRGRTKPNTVGICAYRGRSDPGSGVPESTSDI